MDAMTNLLRLMNLPPSRFSGVVRTSDGFYIARENGDIGYNAFLGQPSPLHEGPGLEHTLSVWNSLGKLDRQMVVTLANKPLDGLPILLERDFGVPLEEDFDSAA